MIIRQFFRDLRTQKMRTLVTLFGIMWGTAAVILLLGIGESFQKMSITSARGLGENIIILWPGRTGKPYKGMLKGRGINLRHEDAELLRSKIPSIKSISPEYIKWDVPFLVTKTPLKAQLSGVYPEWGDMRNMIPNEGGRFINDIDNMNRRRVVFIGNQLKKDLFGDEPAVGKIVYLDKIPFTIVGVLKEKIQNSSYSGRDQSRAVIPLSTYYAMYNPKYLNNMVITAKTPSETNLVMSEIYRVLGKRYTFDPEDKEALGMWDTSRMYEFFDNFFFVFRLFLGVVASLTLVVGGIGVANIMNVVVEERTREIGVKMAVGAKRRTILFDFLNEAVLIAGIGGALGFMLTGSIFKIVNMSPIAKYFGNPHISMSVGLLAFGVLTGVALAAGYFPARRAATLNPIEALR